MCKKQLTLESTVCTMQCDRFQRIHCYFSSPELNKDGNQGSEMAEITHKQFLSRNILQVQNKTNFSLVMLRLTTLG
jgi:hypothetical protein